MAVTAEKIRWLGFSPGEVERMLSLQVGLASIALRSASRSQWVRKNRGKAWELPRFTQHSRSAYPRSSHHSLL